METRVCSICGEKKPLSEFGFHHKPGSRKGDPYRKYCKDCQAAKGREWRADPVHRESLKQTYLNGKKRVLAWKEKHYDEPERKAKRKKYHRKWWLKNSVGITPEQYATMFKAQNGKCAICGATRGNGKTKNLAVDHDHETGRIRGLLCIRCNHAIGSFEDNPTLLRQAATYLEAFSG